MVTEFEYYSNKKPDHTYLSKSFTSSYSKDERKLRFISRVIDDQELHEFVKIKGELIIRTTPSERQEIKALFYEDTREIKNLTIQRFTKRTGNPHKKTHFTFSGNSIDKLYTLIRIIKNLSLESGEKDRLDDELLDELIISDKNKKDFILNNMHLVRELTEKDITHSDLITLAYRKEQLNVFEGLLTDQDFFDQMKNEWGKRGIEPVWQHFFESNPWIFGYGLNYIFSSNISDRKLEQVIAGFNFAKSGKRADALLKTRGLISSLCFVEIKTHNTELLKKNSYRSECWPVSDDLSGSISQIQRTVQRAITEIKTRIDIKTEFGDPTGEIAFLYQPKSYVVIGSLEEFVTDFGVNEDKYSSFELFRRNLVNTEVITFDELFERAKFIVQHSEKHDEQVDYESDIPIDDDVPF